MVYGYIRVSSDRQTVENQRFEINRFCSNRQVEVNGWIEETVSGTKKPDKRKLGKLLSRVKSGDIIVCSEISRLGRSLYMIMDILSICMEKNCKVITIKDNFVLGDDIQSKVLAFAFGLSAEIERNLISQRTKEALAMRKARGQSMGRPTGALGVCTKLSPHELVIRTLIDQGNSYAEIARLFNVNRSTMKRFCDARAILKPDMPGYTVNSNVKSQTLKAVPNDRWIPNDAEHRAAAHERRLQKENAKAQNPEADASKTLADLNPSGNINNETFMKLTGGAIISHNNNSHNPPQDDNEDLVITIK